MTEMGALHVRFIKHTKMATKTNCFVIAILTYIQSSCQFAVNNDVCSTYDSCTVDDFFRTCSCFSDCSRYGTCCQDAPSYANMQADAEEFMCYSQQVPTPIFAKKTCRNDFDGDRWILESCIKESRNLSDLMENVLVTSNRTWTTYWNYNCALCNRENETDLTFWTIQASCPLQSERKRLLIQDMRKSLFYDYSTNSWGVMENGLFLSCALDFFQPAFHMANMRYCTAGLVSECAPDWKSESVRRKCNSYYGERRSKTTKLYYKNVHCALCNRIPLSDLECLGRNYRPDFSKGNFSLIRVVYNLNSWMGEHNKGQPSCTAGFRYDPFLKTCRKITCGLAHPQLKREFCEQGTSRSSVISASWTPVLGLLVLSMYLYLIGEG